MGACPLSHACPPATHTPSKQNYKCLWKHYLTWTLHLRAVITKNSTELKQILAGHSRLLLIGWNFTVVPVYTILLVSNVSQIVAVFVNRLLSTRPLNLPHVSRHKTTYNIQYIIAPPRQGNQCWTLTSHSPRVLLRIQRHLVTVRCIRPSTKIRCKMQISPTSSPSPTTPV